MTDFVNRLLGRPGAPVIRPIVASLFEPPAASVAELPLPMGEVTENDPQRTFEPVPDRPRGAAQGADGARRELVAPASSTTAFSAAAPAPPPLPTEHAVDVTPATVHVPTSLPSTPDGRAVAAVLDNGVTPTAVPAPSPGADHGVLAQQAQPAQVGVAQPRRQESRRAGVAPTRSHPPLSSTATRQDPAEHTAPRAAPAAARRAPAVEPTVHISIGRVEVTAAAEPVAPRRREPAQRPVLNLEDYLRARAGGDRG